MWSHQSDSGVEKQDEERADMDDTRSRRCLGCRTHLYESLRSQGNIKDREVKGRNYIAVHELPRRHVLGNTAYSIEYTQSFTGFVNVNDYSEYDQAISGVAMPLDVALQQALLSADVLLLTIVPTHLQLLSRGPGMRLLTLMLSKQIQVALCITVP